VILAIIVPVLDRPHRVEPTMAAIEAATPKPYRLLFVANAGDRRELRALERAGADHIVVPADRRTYACKINDGVRATTEPLLFLGADDIAPRPGWVGEALAALVDPAVEVVGTVDECNPRTATGELSTHTFVTRRYVYTFGGTMDGGPGVVLHEGYPHDFVDDELVGTAKARGAYVHAYRCVVEHLHHQTGKAPMDNTYRLGLHTRRAGRRVYEERRKLWEDA
jgi:hypothetical protein